ncbi:FAS1-like dehydratase domain-containing protein [Candidatus Poriferisodalis sp.]|uniref:FAS1-like dehydratase domain-containing protein n=1 Tax=Candidatus Poriferisodalis sp. TaxID=3101277 RepID=UPI003C6EA9DF
MSSQLDDLVGPLVGSQSVPLTAPPFTAEGIRRYCYAISESDLLCLDPELAKSTRWAGLVAPPDFCQVFRPERRHDYTCREDLVTLKFRLTSIVT